MKETTIAELECLFEQQKAAYLVNMNPSYEKRMGWLQSLEKMMVENRQAIRDALASDFASHSPLITDMFETGGVLGRNRHMQANLKDWMGPSRRPLLDLVHGTSTVEVFQQPKGVMGNISPWNFPIECSLVMANDMLAAGNRVIIKVSELAPATATLLMDMVGNYFPQEVLAIVAGDLAFAEHFARMPWDHLTYTGNTRVGRLIMQAAAANLTPVTLELGGKNPTIFLDDAVNEQQIKEFLSFKFCKNGQICTSPDYVFVPEHLLGQWVETAKRVWQAAYPEYMGHPDVTGIINETHFDRLMGVLEEANGSDAEVIALTDDTPNRETREMPMYLVVNPSDALELMKEEIFGPITAVKPYRDLDQVYRYINSHDRPLACYLATKEQNPDQVERFKTSTISGGAAINAFGFQAAEPSAPFGGIGASGIGCHSGREGFNNYSHSKTVYHCSDDNPLKASICVPYGELTQAFANAVFPE